MLHFWNGKDKRNLYSVISSPAALCMPMAYFLARLKRLLITLKPKVINIPSQVLW